MDNIITLENVSFAANSNNILHEVSFSIEKGELVTIIGPNGAGKSTLAKIVLGIMKPTSGKVIKHDEFKIGYMPQNLVINPLLPIKVIDFLVLVPNVNKNIINEISAQLEISHILKNPLHSVSGGERQRILLARAILNRPSFLVLDEPTQGVDISGQGDLYKLIDNIRETLHCGVLLISHDLHIVMSGTNRVICLNKHICCHGKPSLVRGNEEFVRMFGQDIANSLAIYTHSHDHTHGHKGNIEND